MSHRGTSHSFVAPSFPLLRALMHFSLPGSACQRITVSFGVGVFSSCASVRRLPHCNEMWIFTKYFPVTACYTCCSQTSPSLQTAPVRSHTYIYSCKIVDFNSLWFLSCILKIPFFLPPFLPVNLNTQISFLVSTFPLFLPFFYTPGYYRLFDVWLFLRLAQINGAFGLREPEKSGRMEHSEMSYPHRYTLF